MQHKVKWCRKESSGNRSVSCSSVCTWYQVIWARGLTQDTQAMSGHLKHLICCLHLWLPHILYLCFQPSAAAVNWKRHVVKRVLRCCEAATLKHTRQSDKPKHQTAQTLLAWQVVVSPSRNPVKFGAGEVRTEPNTIEGICFLKYLSIISWCNVATTPRLSPCKVLVFIVEAIISHLRVSCHRKAICCFRITMWVGHDIFQSSHVLLPFKSFCWCSHPALLLFPRGDVSDLDQPCLSTSAGHKGPQGKLFILTSFQENKPRTLGASVPRGVQKRNPRGCPADEQLSLRGHDLSPASAGKARPAANLLLRLSAVQNVGILIIKNPKSVR